MAKYKIYAVRFKDEKSDEVIDRILIRTHSSYVATCKHFEWLMLENKGFSEAHVKEVRKALRTKEKSKTLTKFVARVPEFHGSLGAGGYELIRTEEED